MRGRPVLSSPTCLSLAIPAEVALWLLSCIAGVHPCALAPLCGRWRQLCAPNSQPQQPLAANHDQRGEGLGFQSLLAELLFGFWSSELEILGFVSLGIIRLAFPLRVEAGIGPRALWGPWGLLKSVGGSRRDSPPRAPT